MIQTTKHRLRAANDETLFGCCELPDRAAFSWHFALESVAGVRVCFGAVFAASGTALFEWSRSRHG